MTLQNHIHLFVAASSPTHATAQAYGVAMPGIDEKPTLSMSSRRGLTGALLKCTLLSGGVPMVFKDVQITLLLTQAQKIILCALAGKDCYYVPLDHDDTGTTLKVTGGTPVVQGYPVLLMVERAVHLDPARAWWLVTVSLQEDSIA